MRAVKNVARNGRTVLVTIHQPSIEIFESFDALVLLQKGGRVSPWLQLFKPCGQIASEIGDVYSLCAVQHHIIKSKLAFLVLVLMVF